jgi:hypothetical protein
MAANPRLVNTDTTFTYDGVSQRLMKGSIVDVPSGSALETAIGIGNLTALDAEDTGGDPAGFQTESEEGGIG